MKRDYNNVAEAIRQNYKLARQHQTVDFVKQMYANYSNFDKTLSLDYIFKQLASFVDISDPDISLPNFYHGIQTAEGIRADGHPEWLQVVGLIHDIGKIMYLKGDDRTGTSIKQQWAIVGDTFVVGCKIPDKIVFPEFNELNPDMSNSNYNTMLGMYAPNCGLDNVLVSWGHDEYLYQILKHNKCPLPDEAFYIIRFHSLYCHHKEAQYNQLMNAKDKQMLPWLTLFNKYDLYTKTDEQMVTNETKKYYSDLVNKYLKCDNLNI
jgi:inositol oxygenase